MPLKNHVLPLKHGSKLLFFFSKYEIVLSMFLLREQK